jgi:hypothetical protein
MRRPMRRVRAIGEAGGPRLAEALEPLMARLLTNADLPAQGNDAFAGRAMEHGVNELETL